jgi:hypothetical protein
MGSVASISATMILVQACARESSGRRESPQLSLSHTTTWASRLSHFGEEGGGAELADGSSHRLFAIPSGHNGDPLSFISVGNERVTCLKSLSMFTARDEPPTSFIAVITKTLQSVGNEKWGM